MGTRWPLSGTMAFDNSGVPAVAAEAYFYVPETTTPYDTFDDAEENEPADFPVVADGNGRWPTVFIKYGSYKEIIKTSGGTTLSSADNIPNPDPVDAQQDVDQDAILQTGDIIFAGANATRTGFVRCNGRTIGSAASSATERANADTEDLFLYVWNNYANGQAAVGGGRGASAAADFAANKAIALPNYQGACLTGFDDMGASAGSQYASAPTISGSGIAAGSLMGANTHALTSGQLASHTHSFSATSSSDGSHTHTAASNGAHTHSATTSSDGDHAHGPSSGGTAFLVVGTGAAQAPGIGANATTNNNTSTTGAHTHTLTTDSQGAHTHSTDSQGSHTHTISGTSGSTGSGTAHNIMARSGPVTVLMKL